MIGRTFANGIDGLHAVGANWAERLTIVRKDESAYGVSRYMTTDKYGAHHWAYGQLKG
ncbi:hypothetical protein OPTIMUS_226 [Mycobacterium phage Optimus]|nr:hypothetical protein AVT17_gp194 [Mycobacterium phage Ariel]YP_009591081.1 hypothetical protein FDG54_gp187 [Mycobacterium phage Optimus]AEJ92249.1 hypothetical protein OPTIMUS_226 [Mycobacterium phage Optimus]AIM50113.1 hypothetical protein PBI_ARIEL_238 [Mycobacterium phage Ariel]ATS93068.1 hypothetical protein SEA_SUPERPHIKIMAN_230 [Mycobacterium phage Superphikiman]